MEETRMGTYYLFGIMRISRRHNGIKIEDVVEFEPRDYV